jgi:predicted secreted acid phosphatase
MPRLKPVIVFDIDETLLDNRTQDPNTLISKGIPPMVLLYNAVDNLINDPPSNSPFVFGDMEERPVDIFFLSARNEGHREVTIQNLSELLRESPTSISKRLILGTERLSDTVATSKKRCIEKLEAKGFTPCIVFEDSDEAIAVYKEHNSSILTLKVSHI